MKVFYVQNGIGATKYSVHYYDGSKKHKDGSRFFDLKICKTKKELNNFVNYLKENGYFETNSLPA